MKIIVIHIMALIFFLSHPLLPQWYSQGSGVWSNMYSIFSIDGQTAWISGANGVILKTTNSGASWIQKSSGTSVSLGYIYFFSESEGIAAGNNGTIKRTTDGGNTWYTIPSGTSSNLNDGSFVNDSLMYLIGWNGTLLVTTDKGSTWQLKPPISTSNYHWVQFWDENLGWASTWFNGQIWKTTDGGNTWSMKIQVGSISLWQVCFVTPEKGFAVGEWGVILKTLDGGENWTQYFAGTQENLHAVYFITPEVGWIVGKDENRLRTSNGGNTWIIEHTGNDYEYLQVYFYNENIGWILGTPGFQTGNPSVILYTDNNGGYPIPVELVNFSAQVEGSEVILNWTTATELNNSGFEIERKFENHSWTKVGFVAGHGTTTEKQIYRFKDQPDINGEYGYRLKQIDYNGTFEYSDEVAIHFNQKFEFRLEQNYPNPFNPTTTIAYSLQSDGLVSLKVYDILGNEVLTLVNENKRAGYYEIQFIPEDLSSGVYLYTLISGDFQHTKKFILLK